MKLSYDPLANIAYLRFHEKRGAVTTLKLSDSVNVDLTADGTIYGIELLDANTQLGDDDGRLIVETGAWRQEVALSA
jgi:uncharacterized protein YuzE